MTDRTMVLQKLIELDTCKGSSSAVKRLSARALKKFRVPANVDALGDEALLDFVERNETLSSFKLDIPQDQLVLARDFIAHVLWTGTSKYYECAPQQAVVPEVFLDLWGDGPGSSNTPQRATHVVDKFRIPGTTTAGCAPWVEYLLSQDPVLYANLKKVVDKHGRISEVQGNRVTTVYKNSTSRRVIAKEPMWNLRFQLALGRHISNCLRCIGFHLESQQPKNRHLARVGSLYGHLATLDLSKASDSITLELIRSLWPSDIFTCFEELRSPSYELRLSDGRKVEGDLNLISTMGNGFTFPMMTLTILALVYANRAPKRRNWIDWNVTAVNGDDIIVPVSEVDSLVALLTKCGFLVNLDKSYTNGPFRESCGGDYEDGKDITPFYIYSLDTEAEVYTELNKVLRWIATHRYPLNNLVNYLLSLVPFRPVPMWMQDGHGIKTCYVPRQYEYLRKVQRQRLKTEHLPADLRLAIYGALSDRDSRHFYVTRECKTSYVSKKAVLPRGYMEGWDPLWGNQGDARYISDYISYMTM